MYGMRRANGDWFAVEDGGGLRVPVFHSAREAQVARGRNRGMMLFAPAAIGAAALGELRSGEGGGPVSFWLVDDPGSALRHGRSLDHAQLTVLSGGGA